MKSYYAVANRKSFNNPDIYSADACMHPFPNTPFTWIVSQLSASHAQWWSLTVYLRHEWVSLQYACFRLFLSCSFSSFHSNIGQAEEEKVRRVPFKLCVVWWSQTWSSGATVLQVLDASCPKPKWFQFWFRAGAVTSWSNKEPVLGHIITPLSYHLSVWRTSQSGETFLFTQHPVVF